MSAQFTPCPSCGAVGEVGKKCLFCSTIITLKEGDVSYFERIPQGRTVTPQQYAEKISIYHEIIPLRRTAGKLLKVSIGNQYGLINFNGDIVYPLGDDDICSVDGDATIGLGHQGEMDFTATSYYNLYTGESADELSFVRDKENPRKLYRVDVENGWKPMNTYTNLEGVMHSYDWAEQIVLQNCDLDEFERRKMYLLHHGNECSLWIPYDKILDDDYFSEVRVSLSEREKALKANPTSPMCVLEGIQDKYTIAANSRVVQIVVCTSSGIDVPLTLAKKKCGNTDWTHNDFDKIYNEWCRVIGKQAPVSRYNYFIQKFLNKIMDDVNMDLDQTMLATIQDYVSIVKQGLANKKNYCIQKKYLKLNITIKGISNLLSVFYLEGDEDNPSGIYLQVIYRCLSEKERDSYHECDFRSYFETEHEWVNLYYDAELICRAIQCLSMIIFGESSNKISLEIYEKYKDNDSIDTPHNPHGTSSTWGVIILILAALLFLFVVCACGV